MTEADIVKAMCRAFERAAKNNSLAAEEYQMRAALRIAIPWAREQALADRDDAAANAKEFRAATERACDEAIVRYKHEARTAREQALIEAAKFILDKKGTLGSVNLAEAMLEALIPARPSQGTTDGG